MCGILGTVIHDGVNELRETLITGLKAVEYRGYDSAGVAILGPNGLFINKRAGKIAVLEDHLGGDVLSGTVGLGHTRWATHGVPSDNNSHPHQDFRERITIVHNGIIENYAELKQELMTMGVEFTTETDTEVAANLIGFYYNGDLPAAVCRAARRIDGSFSMCVMAKDQPRMLIGIRNKLPLLVGHGPGVTYLGSDVTAFLAYTREVTYLADGEIVVIDGPACRFMDWRTGEPVVKQQERVEWDIEQAQKGGFETFMMKEIHEQPAVIRQILERYLPSEDAPVYLPGLDDFAAERETRLISLVGCGTAFHACKVGKYMLEGLAGVPCRVQLAHEALYHQAPIGKHAVTVAVSQSGETADTLGAVRTQSAIGSPVIAIANVVGSSLTREADLTLYTMAGPEISVASTKAFTCQLTVLTLIALWVAEKFQRKPPEELKRLKTELLGIPAKMELILESKYTLEKLARVYRHVDHFYYLGRGISYPVAMEGALKLKEISYVHAEGYAGGEMKHGAIALIEPGFPTCLLAPRSNLVDKMVGNMEEILSRKGEVMVVTNVPQRFADYDVHVFPFPDCPQVLSPLLMSLPLQLFAYYSAKLRDRDIDQPRNLAKSVVVE
ncbi:glutamine--fructose-6-phosphate transaminase (isomerizing) [bacterium]|nr:glutamine--fructose-6-phosphate transaminase (isomerizing) [bacterium]